MGEPDTGTSAAGGVRSRRPGPRHADGPRPPAGAHPARQAAIGLSLCAMPDTLDSLRAQLDEIDDRLVDVLARRQDAVRRVAELKQHSAVPLRDVLREARQIARLADRARQLGVDELFVTRLFREIVDFSVRTQEVHLSATPGADARAAHHRRLSGIRRRVQPHRRPPLLRPAPVVGHLPRRRQLPGAARGGPERRRRLRDAADREHDVRFGARRLRRAVAHRSGDRRRGSPAHRDVPRRPGGDSARRPAQGVVAPAGALAVHGVPRVAAAVHGRVVHGHGDERRAREGRERSDARLDRQRRGRRAARAPRASARHREPPRELHAIPRRRARGRALGSARARARRR